MPSNASSSSSGAKSAPTPRPPEVQTPESVNYFRRVFRLACTAILLSALSADAWEIKSFAGRDHVPLEEIAAFYGLGEAAAPDANTRKLKGSGRELVVTLNSREMGIDGIKHWLAFPVIENQGHVYVSRLDLGKTIEPSFRPALIPDFPAVSTVVLDPGHGGKDGGARSPYEYEKNFALDVARRIRNDLQKSGVRVILTRNSDSFVELADRAGVANRLKNSIFVSLHFNAMDGSPAANGFEIYCVTPRGAPSTAYEQIHTRDMVEENGNEHDIHSFALANAIYHSMQGKMDMFDRGVKRARFAVIRLAEVPSVLIEGGVFDQPLRCPQSGFETMARQLRRRDCPRNPRIQKTGRTPHPPQGSGGVSEPRPSPAPGRRDGQASPGPGRHPARPPPVEQMSKGRLAPFATGRGRLWFAVLHGWTGR